MNKKSLFVALVALLISLPALAQPTRQRQQGHELLFKLVGVWQQVEEVTDSTGNAMQLFLPHWKVLQGDGHFVNFLMPHPKAPAFMTTDGHFRVVSDKYYSERILNSLTNPDLKGVEVMMEYTLDEEKGEMSIRFMLPNSDRPLREVWRKVRMEIPTQLQQRP